jgi:hypothetical protein
MRALLYAAFEEQKGDAAQSKKGEQKGDAAQIASIECAMEYTTSMPRQRVCPATLVFMRAGSSPAHGSGFSI